MNAAITCGSRGGKGALPIRLTVERMRRAARRPITPADHAGAGARLSALPRRPDPRLAPRSPGDHDRMTIHDWTALGIELPPCATGEIDTTDRKSTRLN